MAYIPRGGSTPPTIKRNVINIENLKGVDLYNSPANVEDYRSPNAPNMIRDVPGKVRKRMGYHLIHKFDARINGVYTLSLEDKTKTLIHSGTKLYEYDFKNPDTKPTVIYEGLADERAFVRQVKSKLYILDGVKFLTYGEFEKETETTADDKEEEKEKEFVVKAVSDIAYVPTIIISRNPTGGGTTLEPLNLIGTRWKESFLSDGTAREYQLTTKELDDSKVKAQLLQSDGTYKDVLEGSGLTVDRKTGKVTFSTAPPKSPVTGKDNVIIEAGKSREGYADKINKCKVSILFGVNGSADRLFITGNPEFKNYDWYSQINDPTFFGDTWYSVLGQDSSEIIGYSVISDLLAAHKNEGDDVRNVILRRGNLDSDGKVTFPIAGAIQGRGAVGRFNFAYINEPLFATDLGIYAITAQDITAEKYTQSRSFYIDKALREEDLENSTAITFNEYYVIATDKRVYLLDGLQKTYERNTPYSSYQYECYYWEIPNIRTLFKIDGNLAFGTVKGEIMEFYKDVEDQLSYNDNGEPIPARWDLPAIDGKYFYKNKTFRYMSIRVASAIATGFDVFAQSRGTWRKLFDAGARARFLDFTYIDFSAFSFSGDQTPQTIGGKIKIKKVDKASFSIRNEKLNEPFGIYNIALEYTEQGNFKG